MTGTSRTTAGIAYDRAGPRGDLPVALIHAGIADRRMWDPVWPDLTAEHDAVRLDLRGFGESTGRPRGALCPAEDVLETLAELGIERCRVVGASLGAGVAVEAALVQPAVVDRLLLCPPGGSLLAEVTSDLRAFVEAERTALDRQDLDAAVEANLSWWVIGPHRSADDVDPAVLQQIRTMQRRAFEVTATWGDLEDKEFDPPTLDRLAEINAATLILVGALDLDTTHDAARRVTAGIADAGRVDWPDTAHLPSMERPADFLGLLEHWLAL